MIEIGKIAVLLHDIGNYYGRKEHARTSASMCLYFILKTDLNLNAYKIIEQAIFGHTTGTNIQSAVGAALIIADKLTDANRANHLKEDLIKGGFNNETELIKLNKYINSTLTNKDFVQLIIQDRNFIFNYNVEGSIEDFINEYLIQKLKSMPFILTHRAAAYFECNCIYKVNGDDIDL